METSDVTSDSDSSNSKKPFRCPHKDCNASYPKKSRLTYHIRKHTGERPFICDEAGCSKTYGNSSHLRRHKKISHGEKENEAVLCPHEGCGLVLSNKSNLKRHCNRMHNVENYLFTCSECSQGFHRKRQLQQHVYLHTGEAPFKCGECEVEFTTVSNLNRHKRSHRTHTCDCGEIFDRWSDILHHKKKCKKPRYKCDICDKTFSHLGNYNDHKQVHLNKGEKLVFTCPYPDCKRFYFHKRNIKYHINNFHKKINENRFYNCTYPRCTVKLKTKQSLKMHLQRHFKWVPRKQRRVRCDKGIPKKSMVSILTGEKFSENQPESHGIHLTENMPNELLVKQCDLDVSASNEEILAAN